MGIWKDAMTLPSPPEVRLAPPWAPTPAWEAGRPAIAPAGYYGYAREGYSGNELVYACIEALSTSASEPAMRIRLNDEWRTKHALLRLMDAPNPFMDRFQLWATVIMHRAIAGNAYGLILRNNLSRPAQIWLLRPDRVRVVPDAARFIRAYEYTTGGDTQEFPVEDIIHWRTRNPLNDYYGMPPLLPISGRVNIDNYMRDWTKNFFVNSAIPSGVLTVKNTLTPDQKEEIRASAEARLGGSNAHRWLILDNTEGSFTQTMATPQGLVMPELNKINESRITMAFGVPLPLISTMAGAENASYLSANAARESFWNETLKPLYRELVGPLNERLVPAFPGVDEVEFDLSTVGALQGDVEKKHDMLRKDMAAGGITVEEFRDKTGYGPMPADGTFLVPSNYQPTTVPELEDPTPPAPPQLPAPKPNGNGRVPARA